MRKAAAACLLGDRIGQEFDGIVTGASPKGTWVRVFDPPVEGRVEQGGEGLDVGDRVRVKLLRADPERGFIDFARIGQSQIGPERVQPSRPADARLTGFSAPSQALEQPLHWLLPCCAKARIAESFPSRWPRAGRFVGVDRDRTETGIPGGSRMPYHGRR